MRGENEHIQMENVHMRQKVQVVILLKELSTFVRPQQQSLELYHEIIRKRCLRTHSRAKTGCLQYSVNPWHDLTQAVREDLENYRLVHGYITERLIVPNGGKEKGHVCRSVCVVGEEVWKVGGWLLSPRWNPLLLSASSGDGRVRKVKREGQHGIEDNRKAWDFNLQDRRHFSSLTFIHNLGSSCENRRTFSFRYILRYILEYVINLLVIITKCIKIHIVHIKPSESNRWINIDRYPCLYSFDCFRCYSMTWTSVISKDLWPMTTMEVKWSS